MAVARPIPELAPVTTETVGMGGAYAPLGRTCGGKSRNPPVSTAGWRGRPRAPLDISSGGGKSGRLMNPIPGCDGGLPPSISSARQLYLAVQASSGPHVTPHDLPVLGHDL